MAADWKFSDELQVKALLRAGNALARAIGHNQTCPKVSAAIPCVCGAAGEQAKALADWLALAREYDAA